jgi:aldose 1-epimerase
MGTSLDTSPSGTQWRLAADGQEAVVVEVGGGLRAYSVHGESIVDGYETGELCPGCAGQVLAPWPNRIRDGKYSFGGSSYQLALTEPARHNAIHGLACWLRWFCVDLTASSVTLACDLPPTPGYPWPLRLTSTWSLGPEGLSATHGATNLGDEPAPYGLGTHPYLQLPGVPVDDLVLQLPAQSRLLVDARLLPIGAAKVAGGDFDFTEPRRIGTTVLDSAFGDVVHGDDGRSIARLSTVDDERAVEIWADGSFHWWQVFTGDTLAEPRRRRSVAIEPMTCPPDALRSGRDVIVLVPGETWQGTWGIRGVS